MTSTASQIQRTQHTTSTAVEISSSDHHTAIVVVRDSNGDNDCDIPMEGSVIIARGYPVGSGPTGGLQMKAWAAAISARHRASVASSAGAWRRSLVGSGPGGIGATGR